MTPEKRESRLSSSGMIAATELRQNKVFAVSGSQIAIYETISETASAINVAANVKSIYQRAKETRLDEIK